MVFKFVNVCSVVTHSKLADSADWKKHLFIRWRTSRRPGSFIKRNTTERNASRRMDDS